MDIPKKTATKAVTIQGANVNIPQPFAEGHTCTAGEAAALNQVLSENVRNNCAKAVKEKPNEAQATVDAYIGRYEFGVGGGGGGRSSDPVMTRAMDLARDKVRAAIRKKGGKVADYTAKQITELARKAVETKPAFLEEARRMVQQVEDLTVDLPEKAA